MNNVELILDDVGAGFKKRNDPQNTILRKAKVRIMAYQGAFDGLFNDDERKSARKFGLLPDNFEVHHIVSLCCKNTSFELSNMIVMDKAAHKWLHKNIYSPQLAMCKPGQSCSIWLPEMDVSQVITIDRLQPFIDAWTAYQSRMKQDKQWSARNAVKEREE